MSSAVVFGCVIAAMNWWRGHVFHPMILVGPAVLAALGAFTYRGAHWAREAIVVWFWIIAIGYGIGGIVNIVRFPLPSFFILAVATDFAFGAITLYRSEDVEAVVNPGAFPARASR